MMEIEMLHTGPYLRLGKMELFLFRRCWWGDWRAGNAYSLDADGVFAIATPWFLWYPWHW